MKKGYKLTVLGTVLGLVATATLPALAAEKETVYFATVGTTKPFSYQDGKGKLTGYDVEVARAVFKGSKKYKVSFKKTEWSSIFTGLDSDKYTMGGNNISYSAERAEKYLYSAPIASNPTVLVVPKKSKIASYDDIQGHSTQVVQGTTSALQLEEYNKTAKTAVKLNYTNENITQMLHAVNDEKYDFKIFDKIAVNTIIKEQGLDNLKVIDLPSDQQPYVYFIFGKDQKDVQSFVNKRIKKLYADGTLEKISKKYLNGSYLPAKEDVTK